MKASGVIRVVLVVAVQVLLFVFIWDWLVETAVDTGHEQRGGVAFGATVHYGAIFMGFIFLIASVTSARTSRRLTRWLVIVGLLAGWVMWGLPSLSSYPVRGAVYLSLGALILVVGSGFVVPVLSRVLERGLGGGQQSRREREK